jgi:hypothetical protein
MPRQFYINVFLMCTIAGLAASCHKNRTEPLAYVSPVEAAQPALQKIGQRAEAIVVSVPTEDWPRVYAYIREISDAWQDYKRPTVNPSPEPRRFPASMLVSQLDAALAALKDASAARDSARTIQAANDMNAAAVELYRFYNPTIPPEINSLQVLERQIVKVSTDGDLDGVSDTLTTIRDTWDRAKPTVSARVGDRVVRGFDQYIADQQAALAAGNSEELSAWAKKALAMLDEMSRLYYGDDDG